MIHLVDCGHPPPLLLRNHQVTALQVRQPEPPLGLGEFTDPGYRVETFPFEAGDLLLLYTDGVIDARDRAGTFYPLTERIASWDGDGPEALLRHIRDDLLAHSERRSHDRTLAHTHILEDTGSQASRSAAASDPKPQFRSRPALRLRRTPEAD
ncbi:PP2C family protein-serine/threonine phosphatase [Streptomyces decoyicus]|uniref:PP2C family protein-serine/threonine phosphatase n=1 Tax=Streptomyces decoyicus TaxID=249567 RepID=UPI0036295454